MNRRLVIASMLRVANEDLAAARLLHPTGNRFAIYHCEQAAEKIIRAVLTSEGLHADRMHQLDRFVDQIPDENAIKDRLRGLEYLTEFATTYRYPSDAGRIKTAPAREAVKQAIDRVAVVLTEVAARFEVDLDRADTPAGRVEPIR
jgi:HEPN domain-containing protein